MSAPLPAAFLDADLNLGVSYRQVDYWIRKGYLHPVMDGDGSGYKRLWPESEARVARLMARFVIAGMVPVAAADAARKLTRIETFGDPAKLELAPGIFVEVWAEARR